MKKFELTVFGIALLIILFVFFLAADVYKRKVHITFCERGFDLGSEINQVLDLAEKSQYFFLPENRNIIDGVVVVMNHKAPFLRYGCYIDVQSGKVVSSEVRATD